jgi:hypothetical protein
MSLGFLFMMKKTALNTKRGRDSKKRNGLPSGAGIHIW